MVVESYSSIIIGPDRPVWFNCALVMTGISFHPWEGPKYACRDVSFGFIEGASSAEGIRDSSGMPRAINRILTTWTCSCDL